VGSNALIVEMGHFSPAMEPDDIHRAEPKSVPLVAAKNLPPTSVIGPSAPTPRASRPNAGRGWADLDTLSAMTRLIHRADSQRPRVAYAFITQAQALLSRSAPSCG
jgi:hypothetical protein